MEKNSHIAKLTCTKVQVTKKWDDITVELNCLGPPVRTTKKWIKVWAEMKSKTKTKMSENIVEYRATGGGPNRLNIFRHSEESIMGLLSLQTSVNPPGQEHGLSTNANEECEDMIVERLYSDNLESDENLEVSGQSGAPDEERPRKANQKSAAKTIGSNYCKSRQQIKKMFKKRC
ncbi:uncharacterized protein [Eurosta solidaginis]|uniref:uncharacterized protein n=1 Tax=Eurosta solidaginis TaxID=178769 RepID=UPI003530C8FD